MTIENEFNFICLLFGVVVLALSLALRGNAKQMVTSSINSMYILFSLIFFVAPSSIIKLPFLDASYLFWCGCILISWGGIGFYKQIRILVKEQSV